MDTGKALDRLKFLREDVFSLKLKEFCEEFSLSYKYMRNIECGEKILSKIKCQEITKKIQDYGFNLSDEWIESGKGDFPINSYSIIKGNKYINFDDTNFEQRKWLKSLLTRVFPFTYVCISSSEMYPIIENGDTVFGVKGDPKKNIPKLKDKIVIAKVENTCIFVRRLKIYNNEAYLVSDNKEETNLPSYKINKINWISPIILIKKSVGKIELIEDENEIN